MWPMANKSIRPPMILIVHFEIVTITNGIFYNFGICSGSLPGHLCPLCNLDSLPYLCSFSRNVTPLLVLTYIVQKYNYLTNRIDEYLMTYFI